MPKRTRCFPDVRKVRTPGSLTVEHNMLRQHSDIPLGTFNQHPQHGHQFIWVYCIRITMPVHMCQYSVQRDIRTILDTVMTHPTLRTVEPSSHSHQATSPHSLQAETVPASSSGVAYLH